MHSWRKYPKVIKETNLKGIPKGVTESSDVIVDNDQNALLWYHRNSTNKAFEWTIKSLEIPLRNDLNNVLENRTFGAMVTGTGLKSVSKIT